LAIRISSDMSSNTFGADEIRAKAALASDGRGPLSSLVRGYVAVGIAAQATKKPLDF
jgi:hypothetical protein